jgi:hypothetical protein
MSTPFSCAMNPSVEKTTTPQNSEVAALEMAMRTASRWQLRSNALYEDSVTTQPHAGPREKITEED